MKKIIIANWKANPCLAKRAKKDLKIIEKGVKRIKHEVIICVPFVYLSIKTSLELGAQNCFWEQEGPYTGEVSPKMIKDLGCKYVIIGHSERRKYFGETDQIVNKKLKATLKAGLIPILCIGEKSGENARKVISEQLKKDLKGIIKKDLKKIIIAYEPVWAISTSGGGFCSPKKAKKMMDLIKKNTNNKIIYGGSVDSGDIHSYLNAGFDGALVGGASLDPREFLRVIKNA